MKTLAVLAALAAVATAGPALPGYGYDRYRPVHYRLPAQYRREKKSPQEVTFDVPALDVPAIELPRPELEVAPEVSARTIGLKKPIIVKKNFGYHLYRDSDEEQAQADPQEKCTKEVKVKLCDAESLARTADMRSADDDSNSPMTENDMKHSIKMAKDAVENLQKMTQFQNAELGPDAEMHEDIEVARQALEHIQKNFGNLESMNLQATTLSDAEALQNAKLKIAHTDSERMAQWKEAIDNIQKNAEIARNIEDSFKSASLSSKISPEESGKNTKTEQETMSEMKGKSSDVKEAEHEVHKNTVLEAPKNNNEHVETSIKAAEHEETIKEAENEAPVKKSAENEELLKKSLEHEAPKNAEIEESPKKTNDHIPRNAEELSPEKISEKNAEELDSKKNINVEAPLKKNAEQDNLHEMEGSASEHNEVKLSLDGMPVKAKEAEVKVESKDLEKEASIDQTNKGKSAEPDSSLHAPVVPVMEKSAEHDVIDKLAPLEDNSMKTEKVTPKESDKMEAAFDMDPAQSAPVLKSVTAPTHDTAERKPEEKSAWKENNDMKLLAKSSDNAPLVAEKKIESMPRTEQELVVDTTSLMKSAEPSLKQEKLFKDADDTQIQGKNAQEMMKSAENKELTDEQVQHHFVPPQSPLRSANLAAESQFPRVPVHNNAPQKFRDDFEFQAKNWHADKMSPKNDGLLHNDAEFERNAHFSGQPSGHFHGPQYGSQFHDPKFHHHQGPHGPHHVPHGLHGPHMHKFHGKTAEADSIVQASSPVSSNDANGKAAADQWKQKEAARGAYGAYGAAGAGALSIGGAAGGPGAVGVFPGANVGGCAIPLLLSCSPSVVSGSLAKTSYGAPHAYRANEDIHDNRFHQKRDTKKIIKNEIPTTKVKRTPAKVIQKIPLDKKQ